MIDIELHQNYLVGEVYWRMGAKASNENLNYTYLLINTPILITNIVMIIVVLMAQGVFNKIIDLCFDFVN